MSYTIKDYKRIIKDKDPSRYNHIIGTYETAIRLARYYNIDELKCGVAALLHDYAKNEPIDEMINIIKNHLDQDLLNHSKAIYHGPVGAYQVENKFNIHDQDIINAIKYHVTGHPDMNDIAKIVYISDYIEPGRKHSAVELSRKMALESLDIGVLSCSEGTMEFLKSIGQSIHPLTLKTFQTFLKHVGVDVYEVTKNNCKRVR